MTTDDELLERLRHVLDAVDEPRTRATDAAKAAIGWRDIDAELAQLVFDSRVDDAEPELVMRGNPAETHQLTFSTDEITIDIALTNGGLVGQVIPIGSATVELVQRNAEPRLTHTDEFGAFSIDRIEAGPTTIVVRSTDGGWSVRAAWTAT